MLDLIEVNAFLLEKTSPTSDVIGPTLNKYKGIQDLESLQEYILASSKADKREVMPLKIMSKQKTIPKPTVQELLAIPMFFREEDLDDYV